MRVAIQIVETVPDQWDLQIAHAPGVPPPTPLRIIHALSATLNSLIGQLAAAQAGAGPAPSGLIVPGAVPPAVERAIRNGPPPAPRS